MRPHDETKLSHWARVELGRLRDELERTQRAHAVLFQYGGWFTIGHNVQQPMRLFTCTDHGTSMLCSVGKGDILLVGRAREDHR